WAFSSAAHASTGKRAQTNLERLFIGFSRLENEPDTEGCRVGIVIEYPGVICLFPPQIKSLVRVLAAHEPLPEYVPQAGTNVISAVNGGSIVGNPIHELGLQKREVLVVVNVSCLHKRSPLRTERNFAKSRIA